jgi:hypothetical protein
MLHAALPACAGAAPSPEGGAVVRVWDVASLACVAKLATGHAAPVTSLAWAPHAGGGGGTLLLTASRDGTVKAWAAPPGAGTAAAAGGKGPVPAAAAWPCVATLVHGGPVVGVAVSADGRTAATAGPSAPPPDWSSERAPEPHRLVVWSLPSGARVASRAQPDDDLLAGVTISPDGRALATGSHHRLSQASPTCTVWRLGPGGTLLRAAVVPMPPAPRADPGLEQGSGRYRRAMYTGEAAVRPPLSLALLPAPGSARYLLAASGCGGGGVAAVAVQLAPEDGASAGVEGGGSWRVAGLFEEQQPGVAVVAAVLGPGGLGPRLVTGGCDRRVGLWELPGQQ